MNESGFTDLKGGYGVVYDGGNSQISLWEQQLISGRFSTCQQLWQDEEVGYSMNSPTSVFV
jgi:hypothetical protein